MLEVKFGDEPLIRSPMPGKVALTNHKSKLTNCSNHHYPETLRCNSNETKAQ